MGTAVDHVDDVDAARRPVQRVCSTVQRERIERGVAVMLGGPVGDVAVIEDLDSRACVCPGQRDEPILPNWLRPLSSAVLWACRLEVRTPRGLGLIAVGPDQRGCPRPRSGSPRTGHRRGSTRGCRGVCAGCRRAGTRSRRSPRSPFAATLPRLRRIERAAVTACPRCHASRVPGADYRARRIRRYSRPPVEPAEEHLP